MEEHSDKQTDFPLPGPSMHNVEPTEYSIPGEVLGTCINGNKDNELKPIPIKPNSSRGRRPVKRSSKGTFSRKKSKKGNVQQRVENKKVMTNKSRNRSLKNKRFSPFSSSDDDEAVNFDRIINYDELVNADRFNKIPNNEMLVCRMDARDFTLDYIRSNGIQNPILFSGQQDILDIKIPDFNYREVLNRVPFQQRIDIFNHSNDTQKLMPVSTIVAELEKPESARRAGPYNMLSLECTGMEMSNYIKPPKIVRQIDWAQTVFPKEKFAHRGYSKVEKYILMTMAKSYTEFHIDFGGTSVWYHVKKGCKKFFIVEPTEHNVRLFEEWLNAHRAGTYTGFFGDVVQKCQCVHLEPGNTLILPAGWIHAVYTPVDSLVYGGNFLHEYSIHMQMLVREYESRSQVQKKFQYPFYEQTVWYFAAEFVKKAIGRDYVRLIKSTEYEQVLQEHNSNKCYDLELMKPEFYDEKMDDPCQLTFDKVDEKLNDPPAEYNDHYLRQLNLSLRRGLYKLKSMLQRVYDSRNRRKGSVAEGIRRPRHLLKDFERVIDRLMEMEAADPEIPHQNLSVQFAKKEKHEEKSLEIVDTKFDNECQKMDSQITTVLTKSDSEEKVSIPKVPLEVPFVTEKTEEIKVNKDVSTPISPTTTALKVKVLEDKSSAQISPTLKETLTPQSQNSPNAVLCTDQLANITTKVGKKRPLKGDKKFSKIRTEKPGSISHRAPSVSSLKQKKREPNPLPTALSSATPSADDPVNLAVPLGRKSTRQDYRKLNTFVPPPKKMVPNSTTFAFTNSFLSLTTEQPQSSNLIPTSDTVVVEQSSSNIDVVYRPRNTYINNNPFRDKSYSPPSHNLTPTLYNPPQTLPPAHTYYGSQNQEESRYLPVTNPFKNEDSVSSRYGSYSDSIWHNSSGNVKAQDNGSASSRDQNPSLLAHKELDKILEELLPIDDEC